MHNETKAQKWSFLKHWTQRSSLIIRCWLMDEQTYPQLCINRIWSIIYNSICVCKDICVYLHKYIHIYLHMYKHMPLCVESISLMDDSLNSTFVFKMCTLCVCMCVFRERDVILWICINYVIVGILNIKSNFIEGINIKSWYIASYKLNKE